MDHGAQRIDHAHQRLQLQRRLAGLEIDDEAHSHTCSQRQLRLSEAEAFACDAERLVQLSRVLNGRHTVGLSRPGNHGSDRPLAQVLSPDREILGRLLTKRPALPIWSDSIYRKLQK